MANKWTPPTMRKSRIVQAENPTAPAGYGRLLDDLKTRIRAAQVKAALSVNRELIALYWHIGRSIVERQRAEGWGKAVVERLSADLGREFPGVAGFSPQNIWYMRAFYLAWSEEVNRIAQPARETGNAILQQPVGELESAILKHAVSEIPWGHNIVLLQKIKDPAEIADLYPDTFEVSELGAIPAGWKPGSLGDVADSPRRGVKPSDVPPTTPYIGLEHMPRRNIALDTWGRADQVASGKSQFSEGEILFGKLRPYFHKVGIAPVDRVCSTDIVVVTPKTAYWHGYVISLVSSKAFVDHTDSHSAGTKMPRTNWKDMSRYPLPLPPNPSQRR